MKITSLALIWVSKCKNHCYAYNRRSTNKDNILYSKAIQIIARGNY